MSKRVKWEVVGTEGGELSRLEARGLVVAIECVSLIWSVARAGRTVMEGAAETLAAAKRAALKAARKLEGVK